MTDRPIHVRKVSHSQAFRHYSLFVSDEETIAILSCIRCGHPVHLAFDGVDDLADALRHDFGAMCDDCIEGGAHLELDMERHLSVVEDET